MGPGGDVHRLMLVKSTKLSLIDPVSLYNTRRPSAQQSRCFGTKCWIDGPAIRRLFLQEPS